jgi:hypothetical protein
MPNMSGHMARAVAVLAVTAAALGCLASTAAIAADNVNIPRRPLVAEVAEVSIGNLSRPGFPDGINLAAAADNTSGGLRRPLDP